MPVIQTAPGAGTELYESMKQVSKFPETYNSKMIKENHLQAFTNRNSTVPLSQNSRRPGSGRHRNKV